LAPNEPRLRAALTELPEAVLLAEWYNMIDGISRHYMLPAWWYQETIKRLAADDIRLVRSAKRDPREREQCLPDFWSSPHHDDVYRRVLEKVEDAAWQYSLIATTDAGEPKKAIDDESVLQNSWWPLSQYLKQVAACLGKSEKGAWQEVRDKIEDRQLRARGTYFEIDRQPIHGDWMRILVWSKDDTFFFDEKKSAGLQAPQPAPAHVTNVELWADNFGDVRGSPVPELPSQIVAELPPSITNRPADCADLLKAAIEEYRDSTLNVKQIEQKVRTEMKNHPGCCLLPQPELRKAITAQLNRKQGSAGRNGIKNKRIE